MNVWKPIEWTLVGGARLAWPAVQAINRRFEGQPFQPKWAPAPFPKSQQRSKPTLGFPRTTDSLCPVCVRETRASILSGEHADSDAAQRHARRDQGRDPRARRQGDRRKDLSDRTARSSTRWRSIRRSCGASSRCSPDATSTPITDKLHNHGSSSIKHGRGAVLTIDLTNRCNMMCDPCFMDANQVGYVHELTLDDVKKLLDDAISIKPRRQMTIQFSGGEPTISPIFLDAVRYAREVGYFSVQAATNGIRFAQEPEFAHEARAAGYADRVSAVRRRDRSGQRPPQASATCSTSSCAPSRICTPPASTCAWS